MDEPVQERPGRDHERAQRTSRPILEREPDDSACLEREPVRRDRESTRCWADASERALHPLAVAALVRLRARRPHRRTSAPVEHLELNAGRIDGAAHQSAERVYLSDQMTFSGSADGRIAGHQRRRVSVSVHSPTVQPSRAAAHAASTPGVAGADHNYI